MAKVNTGISLEENLFREVEKRRGLIPRSRYIESLLRKQIQYDKRKRLICVAFRLGIRILMLFIGANL
jgi:metal-responsive CopG/Arc/MetJ family transcriptional regulator